MLEILIYQFPVASLEFVATIFNKIKNIHLPNVPFSFLQQIEKKPPKKSKKIIEKKNNRKNNRKKIKKKKEKIKNLEHRFSIEVIHLFLLSNSQFLAPRT